jgi:hypothetical protein
MQKFPNFDRVEFYRSRRCQQRAFGSRTDRHSFARLRLLVDFIGSGIHLWRIPAAAPVRFVTMTHGRVAGVSTISPRLS